MKKSHILALVVVAIGVAIVMSTLGDASSYVTFKEAWELAMDGNDKRIHVVGELKKDATGRVLGLEPSDDKLSFTFVMVDDNGEERKVFYNEPIPPDFTRSEQVVVIGSFRHPEMFIADKILLKCPSKYQEEQL
jgi:cytochrome c-type biogenesis protein CcmE